MEETGLTLSKELLRKLYSAYPNDNHVGLSLAMSELSTESPKKAKNIFEVL